MSKNTVRVFLVKTWANDFLFLAQITRVPAYYFSQITLLEKTISMTWFREKQMRSEEEDSVGTEGTVGAVSKRMPQLSGLGALWLL